MKGQVTVSALSPAHRKRLSTVRLAATSLQPFLGEALFALIPFVAPGQGTFSVDEQFRLFVDPVVLDRWSIQQAAAVLLHEAGHVIRDHAGRAKGLGINEETHERWNWAADAEINDDLARDGADLPPTPVMPGMFGAPNGKTAEFYYSRLSHRPTKWDPKCGSGSHGIRSLDPTLDGLDSPENAGLSTVDIEVVRRRVAEAVLAGAHQAGVGHGGWQRWAEALENPVVDWRRHFRGAIKRAVAAESTGSEYTYSRPSRRRVTGVVLPGGKHPSPTVAVIVDTSGSMSDELLSEAWTEVISCLRAVGVRSERLRIYAGDVGAIRFKSSIANRVPLLGGGGTDIAESIRQVLNVSLKPDLVLVLTDGYTPWPDKPPKRPVIVGLLGPTPPPPPPWATAVRVQATGNELPAQRRNSVS